MASSPSAVVTVVSSDERSRELVIWARSRSGRCGSTHTLTAKTPTRTSSLGSGAISSTTIESTQSPGH